MEKATPVSPAGLSCGGTNPGFRYAQAGLRLRRAMKSCHPDGAHVNDRVDGSGSRTTAAIASDVFFVLLLAFNVMRTLRHAMWRDELQVFQLGLASDSLRQLYAKLKYEAHGGLWEGLVWLLTRATADPAWMQVMHAVLAAAVWIAIYRWSPFGRIEKFLLLLSYVVFFEYVVVSRSYVLAALCGVSFVALRQHRPAWSFVPWLLLGLMVNLVAHATIWSIALAAGFVLEARRRDLAFIGGIAVYLGLLGFGIATMIPAADFAPWGHDVRLDVSRLNSVLAVPLGAFVPIVPGWIEAAVAFVTGASDAVPRFWNPNPLADVVALTSADTAHPLRLALIYLAPVALCWLIARKPLRVLEFTLAYTGIVAFAAIWDFVGNARHHGIVFLALIAAAWMARARSGTASSSAWALRAVLLVSAVAGVLTLASELRPFSQSRNAAQWLRQNGLADAFLIASRDAQASSVAGYLGRPLYYLECECVGTFIVWNGARQSPLSPQEFRARLTRALDHAGGREPILIRNRPIAPDELAANADPSVLLLQSFPDAETDEVYWIYRVSAAAR
jgi:hypothetical protein